MVLGASIKEWFTARQSEHRQHGPRCDVLVDMYSWWAEADSSLPLADHDPRQLPIHVQDHGSVDGDGHEPAGSPRYQRHHNQQDRIFS